MSINYYLLILLKTPNTWSRLVATSELKRMGEIEGISISERHQMPTSKRRDVEC